MSTIDIEEIKRNWASLRIENEKLQQANVALTRRLANERIRSNQSKLAKAHRIGYIGFLFPLLAVMMHYAFDASVGLCVLYSLFGIMCGAYDLWFMDFVRDQDYMSMPVVEAISHATKVVKYQNRATIISIIAMFVLLVPMFYEMADFGDMNIVWGGVTGLVIGGIIGTLQCIRNHRYARCLLREIKNI